MNFIARCCFALSTAVTILCAGGPVSGADADTSTTQRIVSLNGANTEILFALGAGGDVVGRDDSAMFPPEVNKLPSVGYQFNLNAEGILALKPTLVIGRTDVKPETVIEQIKAAGVRVELVPEPTDFASAGDRIRKVGELVGRNEKAEELAGQLAADVTKFEARKKELAGKKAPRAVFIYLRGPKTVFVLGEKSNPGKILSMAGAEMAIPNAPDRMPVTAEALIAARPDVIVTFTHSLESVGGLEGLLKLPGVEQTPAAKKGRIIAMDDLYLGGFTNRAGAAALELLNRLHGETPADKK